MCVAEDNKLEALRKELPDPHMIQAQQEALRQAQIMPVEEYPLEDPPPEMDFSDDELEESDVRQAEDDGDDGDSDFGDCQAEEACARARREAMSEVEAIIQAHRYQDRGNEEVIEIISEQEADARIQDQLALISDKLDSTLRAIKCFQELERVPHSNEITRESEHGAMDSLEIPPQDPLEAAHRRRVRAQEQQDKWATRLSTSSSSTPRSTRSKSSSVLGCLEVEVGDEEVMAMAAPRTIKVAADSGAGDHVAAAELVGAHLVVPSAGSRSGRHFVAANGDRMRNRGEARLKLSDPKAGTTLHSTFQVADVTRALYSVSKMCDEGCVVTFTESEGTVTKDGKVVARFVREGGLYVAEMEIMGSTADAAPAPFTGRGSEK